MTNLRADVEQACWLNGRFVLRSGRRASRYFDKYQFESNPILLAALVDQLLAKIPPDTGILVVIHTGVSKTTFT